MYIVREGNISQVSRDHTEVQDLLTDGIITPMEAETWGGSNVITRAIGVIALPELEVATGVLHAGDVFVICTDGLTRHLEDDEILRCTAANMSQEACDRLIMLTLDRGAVDNVTIIVVRYDPERALLSEVDANPPVIPE
jgi:protein phosphatase